MDITIHLDTELASDRAALLRLLAGALGSGFLAEPGQVPADTQPPADTPPAPPVDKPKPKRKATAKKPEPAPDMADTAEEEAAEREAIQAEAAGELWTADGVRSALMEVVAQFDQATAQGILRDVGQVERLRDLAESRYGDVIRAAKEKANASS